MFLYYIENEFVFCEVSIPGHDLLWQGQPTADEFECVSGVENGLITVDLSIRQANFEKLKQAKEDEIRDAFDDALTKGHFFSETLKINVDARRGGEKFKADNDNVRTLIEQMEAGLIASPTVYYGKNGESAVSTTAQLKTLLLEMGSYGLNLYKKKKTLEYYAQAATTKEELEAVKW
jgi:hypothetical protein